MPLSNWKQSPFVQNLLLRTATFYVLAGAVAWLLRQYAPSAWGVLRGEAMTQISQFTGGIPSKSQLTSTPGPGPLPALVAMLTALATALPVAWIYTATRSKKGYQQSVVQTIVILPIIIAGIVVLVKHSIELAFSLTGIVAAVRFRTSLDDTKDAANIFVATGIGMASAVEPGVAWVLSIGYNLLSITLWQTDFGRAPPALEGKRAEKAVERALAVANRTGMFVAKLDEEVLDQLAPEQLEAIADRAWRRRKRLANELGDDIKPQLEHMLRIRCTDVDVTRPAAEAQFAGLFSRWKYLGKTKESDGIKVLEYSVAPLENVTPGVIKEILRAVPGAVAQGVELRQ